MRAKKNAADETTRQKCNNCNSHALGREPVNQRAAQEHVFVRLEQVPAAALQALRLDRTSHKIALAATEHVIRFNAASLHVLHLACAAKAVAILEQQHAREPAEGAARDDEQGVQAQRRRRTRAAGCHRLRAWGPRPRPVQT